MSKETKRQIEAREYHERYLASIPEMSNEKLLEEYSYLSGGDDYDGGYTIYGLIEYDSLTQELEKRLKECGFLKTDTNDQQNKTSRN